MNDLIIENAKIIFRNFSGKASQYNKSGDRNFAVVIEDPDEAAELKADGWNVKEYETRPDDEGITTILYYIPVSVSFDPYPPSIFQIQKRGKLPLDEASVCLLDSIKINNADIILKPYNWSVNGMSGVKAYLKAMYVTIEEDELAYKYADLDYIN